MLSRQYGQSLINVLVAMALSSVTIISVLGIINFGHKSQRDLASQIEFGNVIKQISLFLDNPNACKLYFEGKKFNPGASTLPDQMIPNTVSAAPIAISFPSNATRIFAEVGTEIQNKFAVTAVSLRSFEESGDNRYIANLIVTAELPSGVVVSRKTPVGLKTVNNSPTEEEIVECYGVGNQAQRTFYSSNIEVIGTGTMGGAFQEGTFAPSLPIIDVSEDRVIHVEVAGILNWNGSGSSDPVCASPPLQKVVYSIKWEMSTDGGFSYPVSKLDRIGGFNEGSMFSVRESLAVSEGDQLAFKISIRISVAHLYGKDVCLGLWRTMTATLTVRL